MKRLFWFIQGMGSVMGISQELPELIAVTDAEAIAGDFRAVGNDIRKAMDDQ